MKETKLPLTILVFVVLAGSLAFSPSVTTVGQSSLQNAAIETGDTFLFTLESNNSEEMIKTRELWDTDNPSQYFEYDEEYRSFDGFGLGEVDLFFARNVDPIAELDTTFLVDIWQTFQPGSVNTEYRDEGRWDDGLQDIGWNNGSDNPNTWDMQGETYDDDDQESTWSNGTYALITREMTDGHIDVDWNPPFPMDPSALALNQDPPGYEANIINRYTNDSSNFNITINSVYLDFLNVRSVTAEFGLGLYNIPMNLEENFMGMDVTLSGSWNFEYNRFSEFLFDLDTGLLLDIYEMGSTFFWFDAMSPSFKIWADTTNATVAIAESESRIETRSMSLTEASSHWNGPDGSHVRPISQGTYRLEAGDSLNYDIDGFSYYESSMLVDVANGNHKDDRYNMRDVDITGELDMQIYRHDQSEDAFYAVNIDSTTQTGTDEGHEYGWEGGVQYQDHSWGPDSISFTEFRLDEFNSPSNDSYEIAPFLENRRYIELGDDDRDGGDDGGFNIDFDREMPMHGTYVDTKYEDYSINGFNYFIEALVRGAEYKKELIQNNYQIWLGNLPIDTATLNVTAFATQELVYDSRTGALLEFNQEQEVEISIYYEDTVTFSDEHGTSTMDVLFDLTIYIDSGYYIELTGHSSLNNPLYDEVQTDIPTDPSTVVTTTPVDTNTTTTSTTPGETSSDDTSDENTTPDLPLPVPFLPFAFGLAVITILYKRK
ncbi:MAG: hypothetical protein ACXAD7_09355 [Candidatus Kariarchaeaceae archaeon]